MKSNAKWIFISGIAVAAVISASAQQSNDLNSSSLQGNGRQLQYVQKASKLIGDEVQDTGNHKVGDLQDIVVALESGRVLYAVVSTGESLGNGKRLVSIPPGAFTASGNHLTVDIEKQKLAGAPEFDKNQTNLGSVEFVTKVYQSLGEKEWWQGPDASTGGSFHNVHLATDLVGMNVNNVSNQKIADVNNLLVDLPAGRVLFVVIAPDKSLNLGNNLYALPPNALTPSNEKNSLTTGVTRERLASAPHFDKSNWPDLSNPLLATEIYHYYGKQPYFQSELQPTGQSNRLERIYHEPGETNR